jgi:hypothetical protein
VVKMQLSASFSRLHCLLSAIITMTRFQYVVADGIESSDYVCDNPTCSTGPKLLASTNFISPKSESELSEPERIDFTYPSAPYIVTSSAFTLEIHGFNLRRR